MSHYYIKELNTIDVCIANRVEHIVRVASNAKMVRNLALEALIADGIIPPQAKAGWLSDPGRRRGCTPTHNEYLDGLNRLFNAAKYHFGEDGKKARLTSGTTSSSVKGETKAGKSLPITFSGLLVSATKGTLVLDLSDSSDAGAIEELVRLSVGHPVEISIARLATDRM